MREGDDLSRSVLRLVRAAIQNEEIAQGNSVDDAGVIQVIARMVRQHRESIDQFTKGNRQDLVQHEEQELAVLLQYMPSQLSMEELTGMVRQAIRDLGATSTLDKGKVMGRIMPQVRGRAEGAQVNDLVASLLENADDG